MEIRLSPSAKRNLESVHKFLGNIPKCNSDVLDVTVAPHGTSVFARCDHYYFVVFESEDRYSRDHASALLLACKDYLNAL